ncbi:hypothetical protein ACOMHN_057118 [Nucella lapillus]
MELGILHNSPPSTKRGCRAGRLHRLWHGLPPAPWPCTRSQHHSVPSRNLHPLMVPPFLQPHPDLQSAVGNAPLSSKHPAQLPTTDCLLSIISPMGGQPSDAPALSPPSPLQQGGQSSNAPALSPPSPLPQGGQPIALALSPPSPPPQGGQPSDAPGLSPSSSTLLLCPSDSTLNICHLNSQSAVKTAVKKEDLPVLKCYYYPPFYSLQDGKVRTATYVKDSLQTAPIRVSVRELSTACEVIMQDGSRLSLVNIYYPESCNHADLAWLQNLDAAHWVIVGDFNAHHSWWGGDGSITDAAGRQLAEKIMTSDLCLLNDGTHTRVPDRADHGATAIDLTLVSSSLYGEAEWETSSELWGSDHLPISLLLRGVQLREDSVARVTYDYSNADWNGFQHLLATAVYPSPTDNIEIWYEDLRDVILQAAEEAIRGKAIRKETEMSSSIIRQCDID